MTFQRAIIISMAVITLVASVVHVVSIYRVFTGKMMDVFISLSPFSALISLIVINIHSVFDMVPATEAQKLVVQTFAYVILKGAFASLVVPPTLYQARLWSAWLILILFQKMFLYVSRIGLQRLMKTSPSATPWSDARIDSAFDMYFSLLAILAANVYWMNVLTMYQTLDPSTKCFLIFYEPLSITFETLHTGRSRRDSPQRHATSATLPLANCRSGRMQRQTPPAAFSTGLVTPLGKSTFVQTFSETIL